MLLRSPGPSLYTFRLGIIRFGSWDSLASSGIRQKGMPRKVGDQGSQRQWLAPFLHLCCHRLPLHYSHRIPTRRIPPIHSSHYQDFSKSHHRPSWTLQGGLCMYRNSSFLDPFYPLMHITCNTRPFPKNMVVMRTIMDGRTNKWTIGRWPLGRPWLRRTIASIMKLPKG